MEPEVSNTELWKAEYYQESYDSLIAVHRILGRAIKFKNITVYITQDDAILSDRKILTIKKND